MRTLDEVIKMAKEKGRKRVAVVGAEDLEALKAVIMADEEGFATPVLVGDSEKIKAELDKLGKSYDIVHAANEAEAAEKGVRLVSSGAADVVMKGYIKTATLLKAVLNKEWGLRTGGVLSHNAVIETEHLKKLLIVTDGGMVLKPDLQQKIEIINNAVKLSKALGVEKPKVAVVAAVEVVNPDLPETMDAALLTQMWRRGQIKDCIVDGPLGVDIALSEVSAKIKHVENEVTGDADIILVPDINCGNLFGKAAVYLAGGRIAGIVSGAKAPIVIISRADTAHSKLASLALGVLNA